MRDAKLAQAFVFGMTIGAAMPDVPAAQSGPPPTAE